eukprot:m.60965 g.60965  ORF g.60965 m.60965 type:complete len:705 (+) comp11368_c0_seq1:92-2206(+)
MGITQQFRSFGTYPRLQLADPPGEDPATLRTRNWKAVQRYNEEKSRKQSLPPKLPTPRHPHAGKKKAGRPYFRDDSYGTPNRTSSFHGLLTPLDHRPSPYLQPASSSFAGIYLNKNVDGNHLENLPSTNQQHSTMECSKRLLDAEFIFDITCVEDPREVFTANVHDCDLGDVNMEEMRIFSNLTHLDISANTLPIGQFANLKSLEVLEAAVNNISDIELQDSEDQQTQQQQNGYLEERPATVLLQPSPIFPSLRILDLSHNNLSQEGVRTLGRCPLLESLNLTSNSLKELPLDLTCSQESFVRLKTLILDENHLESPQVFQALAGLPSITTLDLSHNKIKFVPSLVPKNLENEDDIQPEVQQFVRPFQSLTILDLAHNLVRNTEDVQPAFAWNSLEELRIWGNPIVTQKKASSTRLMEETNKANRNIKLVCKEEESSTSITRPITAIKSAPLSKVVPLVLPPIPRGTALMAFEQRKYIEYNQASESPSPVHSFDADTPDTQQDVIGDAPSDDDDEAEGGAFFMTEVDTDPNARTQTQETVNHGRESLPQEKKLDTTCSEELHRTGVEAKDALGSFADIGNHDLDTLTEKQLSLESSDAEQIEMEQGSFAEIDNDNLDKLAAKQLAIVPRQTLQTEQEPSYPNAISALEWTTKTDIDEAILFREESEEEKALTGPPPSIPDSPKASLRLLKFMLEKPLTYPKIET